MPRITIDFLNAQISRLNKIVLNNPKPAKSTINAFTLSETYGGYALHQYTSEHYTIRDIFNSGYITKRQLSQLISAFESGLIYKNMETT